MITTCMDGFGFLHFSPTSGYAATTCMSGLWDCHWGDPWEQQSPPEHVLTISCLRCLGHWPKDLAKLPGVSVRTQPDSMPSSTVRRTKPWRSPEETRQLFFSQRDTAGTLQISTGVDEGEAGHRWQGDFGRDMKGQENEWGENTYTAQHSGRGRSLFAPATMAKRMGNSWTEGNLSRSCNSCEQSFQGALAVMLTRNYGTGRNCCSLTSYW